MQRRGGRGGEAEEEKRKEDGRKLRNLTTPHRVVGNKIYCFSMVWSLRTITSILAC